MPRSKTLIALTLLALSTTVAQAGDWTNSSVYNGYGTANSNHASGYSMRDANGNLIGITRTNSTRIQNSQIVGQTSNIFNAGGVGLSSSAIGNTSQIIHYNTN